MLLLMMGLNIDESQRFRQIIKLKAASIIHAIWYDNNVCCSHQLTIAIQFTLRQYGPSLITTLGHRAPSCAIWCTIGPYQNTVVIYSHTITIVVNFNYHPVLVISHLNILQPWAQPLQSNSSIHHIPYKDIQSMWRQETLVSSIVFLLVSIF